jgi:hypothetical protein
LERILYYSLPAVDDLPVIAARRDDLRQNPDNDDEDSEDDERGKKLFSRCGWTTAPVPASSWRASVQSLLPGKAFSIIIKRRRDKVNPIVFSVEIYMQK